MSTLDFPGLISAVIFTQGCNFTCPYCHNPALVRPFGELINEAGVVDFLWKRRELLDGVVISGGEPTIIPDLPDFLETIRSMGYKKIKLDTNGGLPDVLSYLLQKRLVDYVALDIKTDPLKYPKELAPITYSSGVIESISILKTSKCPHEYRTTVVRPFVTKQNILSLATALAGEYPLYLQKFRPKRVLDPEYMKNFLNQPVQAELLELKELASRFLPCTIR